MEKDYENESGDGLLRELRTLGKEKGRRVRKLYSLCDRVLKFSEGINGEPCRQRDLAELMSYKLCDIVSEYNTVKKIEEKINNFRKSPEVILGPTILEGIFYDRFYPRRKSPGELEVEEINQQKAKY